MQLGLNKGEAKNALARAVFFNRLGELRDRSFENQRYRASGLNLVVAAIVVGGRIKTSQLGSNQNQPLFSYKPFEDVLARG